MLTAKKQKIFGDIPFTMFSCGCKAVNALKISSAVVVQLLVHKVIITVVIRPLRSTTPRDMVNLWSPIYDPSVSGVAFHPIRKYQVTTFPIITLH